MQNYTLLASAFIMTMLILYVISATFPSMVKHKPPRFKMLNVRRTQERGWYVEDSSDDSDDESD